MMNILLIEDEDRSARHSRECIERAAPVSKVIHVTNRDAAQRAIAAGEFDLIVCDLRIPPTETSADISETHGLSVHALARKNTPGTPTIFLTAFSTNKNVKSQLSSGGVANIYGMTNYPLCQLVVKDDLDEFEAIVAEIYGALASLESEVGLEDGGLSDEMFLRASRMYAQSLKSTRVVVHPFRGLSGATVARLELWSRLGKSSAVMKVGARESIADEYYRYTQSIPTRLAPGDYAPCLPPTATGLRRMSSLVSNLASPESRSLFHLLQNDATEATEVILKLRDSLSPWTKYGSVKTCTLADLRRARTPDVAFAEYAEMEVAEPDTSIEITECLSHGDLHGENVLVDPHQRPVLIDFGDVGPAPSAIDPITLELSLIFHSEGPARATEWAKNAAWNDWADIDAFTHGSPFEAFQRACRTWALEVAGDRATMGVAYAHAIRQLKYPDTEREIAMAIAASARDALDTA